MLPGPDNPHSCAASTPVLPRAEPRPPGQLVHRGKQSRDSLKKYRVCAQSLQSCPTVCDPMDCSLPRSSVHETLQAGILEWVATPSSRGSSWPRDGPASRLLRWQAGFLPLASPGKPIYVSVNVICINGLQSLKNKWYHTVYIFIFFHSAFYF